MTEVKDIQFSESNDSWSDIPQWALFLIMFGYYWAKDREGRRRVALISMPCDSPGAGLVALGSVRKYLEDLHANDIEFHLERIRNEQNKTIKSRNILLHKNKRYNSYKFYYDGKDSDDRDVIVQIPRVRNQNPTLPFSLSVDAKDVYFDGEPCLEVDTGNKLPYGSIYRELISEGGEVKDINLRKTYSGICLAGRIMGANTTRDILSSIRFQSANNTVTLDHLLAVHDWSSESISRLLFYNSRTKKLDRQSLPPRLVIVDGDAAFFKVYSDNLFEHSDIIVITDRTLDRDRLTALAEKMESLSQWYDIEPSLPVILPKVPKGVSLIIRKQR